ncbi:MAG TPA: penicillin-binding protein 2, partial [Dehalococcoidia bacterium]|nr:penicillin-binding protein 2 [Dehalococcoidia bacterium]
MAPQSSPATGYTRTGKEIASVMRSWRLGILTSLLALSVLALAGRLAHIQLRDRQVYLAQAEEEHLGRQTLLGRRGAILDRNGSPLAVSVDTYDVYVSRKLWQDTRAAQEGAKALAPFVKLTPEEIIARAAAGPAEAVVARDIEQATGEAIASLRPLGVRLVPSSRRFYPEGNLVAPLLGFIGRDKVGLTGLEADLEDPLRGQPGFITYERDGAGRTIPLGHLQGAPPQPGADVVLTIDRYLQKLAEEGLAKAIRDNGAKGGDLIVIDTRTGEILAMASYPSFDPANPNADGDGRMALFKNRALTDIYEPGSIFKLITAAGALNEGLVTPNSSYVDTGKVVVDGWPIFNWDYSANGPQTVTQLLSKSLNTGAIWLAQLLAPERFYQYVQAFGFGQPTGIGLHGEAAGYYRTPSVQGWSKADLAVNSFGQGIGTTPLQMAAAIAAIANEGKLMRPYVVKELTGPQGRRVYEPQVVRQVIKPEAAKALTRIMTEAVEGVSWHPARVPGYTVAGKTGTANIPVEGRYDAARVIASFAG